MNEPTCKKPYNDNWKNQLHGGWTNPFESYDTIVELGSSCPKQG